MYLKEEILNFKNNKIMNSLKLFLSTFAVILFLVGTAVSQSNLYNEEIVKAVFIQRISEFVEWPWEDTLNNSNESFVIGIIGETSLEKVLRELYTNRTIKSKKVGIYKLENYEDIANCDLLFISESERNNISKIIKITRSLPVLTISDTMGFSEYGVIINFYMDENKVKFELNDSAARESILEFSHHLYKIAKIVNPKRSDI